MMNQQHQTDNIHHVKFQHTSMSRHHHHQSTSQIPHPTGTLIDFSAFKKQNNLKNQLVG
jgi:hypothetical protein